MTDPIIQLQDAQAKAAAKVKRLRGQLEAAESELSDLETAMRVLDRISGAKAPAATGIQSDNGALIWGFVGIGRKAAQAPKEVIEALHTAGHELGADLVRTQLWRMAKRGDLKSEDGVYWRPIRSGPDAETENDGDGNVEPDPAMETPTGWEGVGRTSPLGGFRDDLDDDIPF